MQIYRHGQDNRQEGPDYKCISPDVKSHRNITKKVQNYLIKLDDVLGKGSFSTVYRAVEEKTEEVVAVKVIELNKIQSPTLLELLYSEIEILKSIRHPNILQCYEVFFSANNCYIVTEYCNEGDVKSLVAKAGPLSQKAASKIVLGVFEGLKYLSRQHIVHRDLKTANVFMKNGKPKIADFGFAKRTKQPFKDINIGSPVCMSPEGIIHNIYGPKSDVWAFGIFLYQIFHGNNLFGFCRNEDELREAVVQQVKPQGFYHKLSNSLKEMIVSCLEVNQQKRTSIQNLEYDPYIRKLVQSAKSSNILVSQVQEYTTKTHDSTVSTEVQFATQRRSNFTNRPVDILAQESKNTTSKLYLDNNEAIKSDRYIRANKYTSFDTKVSSPKESGKFIKKDFLQAPESKIRGGNTSNESGLQHRNSMNLGDKKCMPASLKKDVKNQTSLILNYKSASTFNRTQKDRAQRQILPSDMQFEDLLALLHYCRMLYKTIKTVSQYSKDDIDCLSSWLFFILAKIKSRLGGAESSAQFKKLRQILNDYTTKYKKELFLNVEVQPDHQKMQRMLLKTLNDLQYGSKDKGQGKTKALAYVKFLYDLNQMLGQAMSKGKYRGFTERNGVEEFLGNMQEGLIYRPRRTNYNFQK